MRGLSRRCADYPQSMSQSLSPAELELARLLVEALCLEDITAEDIAPEAPLFGQDADSLGLDSIDALEIAQLIAQQYQVQLKADDENNKAIFRTLRSLSAHVQAERAGA